MLAKLTLLLTLIAMMPACTKSADEQAEPVDENAADQGASNASATGSEKPSPQASDLGTGNAEASVDAASNTSAEIPANTTGTPADPTSAELPPSDVAAPTAGDSTAAAASAAGKVVRYALNDTAILANPEASASQVSTLKKGESVLIEDLGAFGKISDGKFVSKKDLSEKAVPRDSVSNPWK
ncbi:MAG: hypothetical protein WCI18_04265 [Pseudomonadota bacterium]